MRRLVTACLVVTFLGTGVFAETAHTEQSAPAPQAKKFVPPVRGEAQIEILTPQTKVVGEDVVTKLRIRNVSKGSIALLTVSETWYDKQGNAMPGDSQKYRKPFLPGEVIDMELHTPKSPKFFQNNFQFTHANGKIKVTSVKSFPTTPPAK